MKKNFIVLMLLLVSIFTALYFYSTRATSQKIYTTQEANQIIDDIYNDVSGFSIDTQERAFIENQGGNPTYGEITGEAVSALLDDLALTADDVFFDLGAGVGKACVQVALCTPSCAIGIELSPTRCQNAQAIKDRLEKRDILTHKQKLKFIEQNITDTNLNTATVVFLCSTCFSDTLMNTLVNKMADQCKAGLRIITLKELPARTQFELVKTYELAMSWSESSSVHLYQLKK